MGDQQDDVFTRTRRSLHAVAEHVLAAARYGATGRIGLRPTPGGFGTPAFPGPAGTRRLRIDGVSLVVDDDGHERRAPLVTLRAAAEHAGISAGAPADVYRPATPLELDRPLEVDAHAAQRVAAWFGLTAQALERLRDERRADDPSVLQLWPEHFDLATTIGEVNYGASAGDDAHDEPYLYVGPFEPPPRDGDYWNEPFGSSVAADRIGDVADALAYLRAGHDRLVQARSTEGG